MQPCFGETPQITHILPLYVFPILSTVLLDLHDLSVSWISLFFFIIIRHIDHVCILAISYSKHVPMLFLSSKHPREWLFKSSCTPNYLLIRRSSFTKVPLYKVPAVHIILCEKGDLLYGKSVHYKIWFNFTSFFHYVAVM